MEDPETAGGCHETSDEYACQDDPDTIEQGCTMEMGKTNKQYPETVHEITHPVLIPNDRAYSNFPISNIPMVNIDSENRYKIERSEVDQSITSSSLTMTVGELHVIIADKRDGLNDVVEMKSVMKETPSTTVDEDDGVKKGLAKFLCGTKSGKLIDDDSEPYRKVQENFPYKPLKIHERDDDKKKEMNNNAIIGERLAYQDTQENTGVVEHKETNSTGESNVRTRYNKRAGIRTPGTTVSQSYPNQSYPGTTVSQSYPNQSYPGTTVSQSYPNQSYPGTTVSQSYPNQTNVQSLHPIEHPTVTSPPTHSTDSDLYNFTHGARGYMLVVVNDRFVRQSPRDGAYWDLLKMKEISRKFGFRSLNYNHERNLSKSETLELLHAAKTTDHSDCDCFMFMMSTHGLEYPNPAKGKKVDHALVCADDRLIFTSTIMEMFNDTNCPTLKGKPKLFFIQACRGEELDHGSDVFVAVPTNEDKTCSIVNNDGRRRCNQESFDVSDTRPGQDSWAEGDDSPARHQSSAITSTTQTRPPPNIPSTGIYPKVQQQHTRWTSTMHVPYAPSQHISKIYAPTPYAIVETPSLKCDNDMLVMYAIPPGLFAWRNTSGGSWMIDYLYQVLMAYDMRQPKNFLNLLTKVSALMNQRTTNTPSNPDIHGKKAISVIEHKLTKDIVFQQKTPGSGWVKESRTVVL